MTGGVPIYNTTLYRVYFRIMWLFNVVGSVFFFRKSLIFLVRLGQKQKTDPGDIPIVRLWWDTLYMLPTYSNGLFFVGPSLSPRWSIRWQGTAYIEKDVMSFYKLSSVDRHLHCCWAAQLEKYIYEMIHLKIYYIKEVPFKIQFNLNCAMHENRLMQDNPASSNSVNLFTWNA